MSNSPVPRMRSISLDPYDYLFFDISDLVLPSLSLEFDNLSPDLSYPSQPPPASSPTNIINHFDFSSLISALNQTSLDPLYNDPDYLNSYLLDQHIDNIKTWMRVNSHHTFPKSKHGWLNVLYMHFQKIYIHMDLDKILELVNSNRETRSPRINQLVKRIRKLMRGRTFACPMHPRTRHRLLAHCNIYSFATPEKLYDRMLKLGIVSEKKRRKQFKPIKMIMDKTEGDDDDLSNMMHSFKRVRLE